MTDDQQTVDAPAPAPDNVIPMPISESPDTMTYSQADPAPIKDGVKRQQSDEAEQRALMAEIDVIRLADPAAVALAEKGQGLKGALSAAQSVAPKLRKAADVLWKFANRTDADRATVRRTTLVAYIANQENSHAASLARYDCIRLSEEAMGRPTDDTNQEVFQARSQVVIAETAARAAQGLLDQLPPE